MMSEGQVDDRSKEGDSDESNEPNHLIWRRLQLSKAKLKGVTEMAALMAGFSVVSNFMLNSKNQKLQG